jgi:hypothetical protein
MNYFLSAAAKADSVHDFTTADVMQELISVASADISPPFGLEDALIIADAIGIEFDTVDFELEDFRDGLAVELEHGVADPQTDVIHENYLSLGKIAWAHLKEDPLYYEKLETIED